MRRAVAEQAPVQFEYFYPKWNRWFENYVYPSADGVSIIATDISERKQAEAKLRQREAELREAQRIGNIGSWYWDAKTDITTGSDELLRIYGL